MSLFMLQSEQFYFCLSSYKKFLHLSFTLIRVDDFIIKISDHRKGQIKFVYGSADLVLKNQSLLKLV